jgi:uncharacterized protein YjiS (DUF1127 family)
MTTSTIEAPVARRADLNAESWPAALARPIKHWIAWIGSRRRLRRDVKELMALDDRILRDIGLNRSDVEHAARYGRAFDRLQGWPPLVDRRQGRYLQD